MSTHPSRPVAWTLYPVTLEPSDRVGGRKNEQSWTTVLLEATWRKASATTCRGGQV